MKKVVFFFAAIAALSSCTITKRHYAPGYHVDWKSRNSVKVNQDLVEETKQKETIEPFVQLATEQVLSEVSSSSNARTNFELMNSDVVELNEDQLAAVNTLPAPSLQIKEEPKSFSQNEGKVEVKAQNYFPEPAPEEDINKMALIGFICSAAAPLLFLTAIPGLIISIIGYKQVSQGIGSGKGLAIAGIVLGALYTFVTLIYVAYLIFMIATVGL
jgi:hypothetical protein